MVRTSLEISKHQENTNFPHVICHCESQFYDHRRPQCRQISRQGVHSGRQTNKPVAACLRRICGALHARHNSHVLRQCIWCRLCKNRANHRADEIWEQGRLNSPRADRKDAVSRFKSEWRGAGGAASFMGHGPQVSLLGWLMSAKIWRRPLRSDWSQFWQRVRSLRN